MSIFIKHTLLFLGILSFVCSCDSPSNGQQHGTESPTADTSWVLSNGYQIQAPFTHKNLAIYPVVISTSLDHKKYLSLEYALEKKLVEVHETGSVNNLEISNNSDQFIYIGSGDIVKGGKQDRTLKFDVIIPPNTKKIGLASFCVEQGRWRKRKNEEVGKFGSSKKMLSSKELKIAARYKGNQSAVWGNVAKTQEKLTENVSVITDKKVDVKSGVSSSSLQLTLENEDLKDIIKNYNNALWEVFEDKSVVGFFYSINGEMYGGDVYNNTQLFTDRKVKHLDAMITEAVAERSDSSINYLNLDDLRNTLVIDKDSVSTNSEKVNSETLAKTDLIKSRNMLVLHTIDIPEQNRWLHRSYLWSDDIGKEPQTQEIQQIQRSSNYIDIYPIQEFAE